MGNERPAFVKITSVQGQMTAEVLKSHLESEGIPVILRYESAGHVFGIIVNGLGKVDILVPEDLLDVAQRILALEDSDHDPP